MKYKFEKVMWFLIVNRYFGLYDNNLFIKFINLKTKNLKNLKKQKNLDEKEMESEIKWWKCIINRTIFYVI